MNLKEAKEILDIVHDIKEIDEQLNSKNPQIDKLQEITLKAKQKFPNETGVYEVSQSLKPGTEFIPVNQMPINELLQRLPYYRNLYIYELIKKYGQSKAEDVLKEYNIKC